MGMVAGNEQMQATTARKVLAIIERFTHDRALDRLHLLLASTPVLESVG
jgi:hypothetical protein